MSVNVGHVFVRTQDIEALRGALLKFLESHATKYHSPGMPDGKFIDMNGQRTVLMLPAVRGWTTILESDSREADLLLAQTLSETLKARTIWFKVSGCVFDYEWTLFENGVPRSSEALNTKYGDGTTMPLFQDAELLAWQAAIKLGIPTQTLFLQQKMYELTEIEPLNAAVFTLVPVERGVRLQGIKVHVKLQLEPVETRVILDTAIGLDQPKEDRDRVAFTIETRFLYGDPDPRSIENLTMLLRRIQNRYSRESRLPKDKIKFMVRSGGTDIPLPSDLS